jgi:putative SOS response-associated peptidase YedK
MCGRYTRRRNADRLAAEFEAGLDASLTENDLPGASYNVAPGQACPVIVSKERKLQSMRWGLVPSWSKSDSGFATRINACGETLTERSSYRPILARGRCVVPADGFYEWQQPFKQPFFFKLRGDESFGFAGLSDTWEKPDGSILKTFTLITTSPNELVAQVHDRMPAILERKDIAAWLDPETLIAEAMAMLKPYSAAAMESHPVRPMVNSVKNNGPQLVEPIALPERLAQVEFNW